MAIGRSRGSIAVGGGGGGGIVTQSDVVINAPVTNQTLIYKGDTKKWVNAAPPAAWSPYILPTAPPLAATWSVLNAGNGVLSNLANSVLLTYPALNAAATLYMQPLAGAAPYTVEAGFTTTALYKNWTGFHLVIYSTVSGLAVHIDHTMDDSGHYNVYIAEDNANGTLNANIVTTQTIPYSIETIYFRIVDDGVNRTFYLSVNGRIWLQVGQHASGTWVTPNRVGFRGGGVLGAPGALIECFHWKIS